MMVYSVGNITECVELGRNEARLVAQGLRLVHCDLSGLLEAEGPEDRAVPDQDLVPVTAGLEAHDGASESLAELCEGDHVSVLLLGRGRRVAWRVLRLRCALRKTSYRCIRHSSTHERGEYSQSHLALRGSPPAPPPRSEEHTSELQSLMRI